MKILKDPRHAPLLVPVGLGGKMYLAITAMILFDLDDPDAPLTDRELWAKIPPLLPDPPILDPGLPKPGAELLVAGRCCTPGGQPRQAARVSVRAGDISRSLDVFGDRFWQRLGPMHYAISAPKPFTVMPLTWERAFGGRQWPQNPKGIGIDPVTRADASPATPLPNIEDPARLIGSPDDRPPSACLAALAPDHPSRLALAGTYDEKWRVERWPDYPDDFNPDYFRMAPPGQRLNTFFTGGEPIEIAGMHPDRPLIASRLPGLTVRVFLTRKESAKAGPEKDTFEEVATRVDTLWLFPDILRGVAVFRGVAPLKGRDYPSELRHVFFAAENPGDPGGDLAHYLEVRDKRLAAMKPLTPSIPDVGKQVDRAMLKLRRVGKDLADIKASAMGKTPVMPREPEEMGASGLSAIQAGLAVVDKMEAVSAGLKAKFGWRVSHDPAAFQAKRDALTGLADTIQQQTASATKLKAGLVQTRKDILAKAGQDVKERVSAADLAKAGIDPDNLLPSKDMPAWHQRGFPFVVECRRALENNPALMARLENLGLARRTVRRAWMGFNPNPAPLLCADWGLAGGESALPPGLVLPRFSEKTLVRALVLRGFADKAPAEWKPLLAPGSDPAPAWLPAPDDGAPVVVAASELEAWLFEQEVGDVCAVAVLDDPAAKPADGPAAALKAAPVVLVCTAAKGREHLAPATPWLALAERAVWFALPGGAAPLEAKARGLSLRDLVLDAIPPAALGLDEAEPGPAYGPPAARKRPPVPDIGGMTKAAVAEITAFHESKRDAFTASLKPVEDRIRAELAKHGKDFDAVMAEAKAAPRTPFDQTGDKLARDVLAKRNALLAEGSLTPEADQQLVKAAQDARRLGAQAEARWQEGQKTLAEAARKLQAATGGAGGRALSPEVQAGFEAAGVDISRMVRRSREEVVAMHRAGEPLCLAVLAGVDLSGLDLSGADFSGCRMKGANLKGARLDNCVFTKTMAQEADFTGASLIGATLDRALLNKAGFKKANLSGASLTMASLNKADLAGADLSGASLAQTSMQGANLARASLAGAKARLCVLRGVNAPEAFFSGAAFERCMLASMTLDRADFSRASFAGTQLDKCSGEGVRFCGAVFRKGSLLGCALPGADFSGADALHLYVKECELAGADFRQSRFTRCRFGKSRMMSATLEGARFRFSSFPDSDLTGADMRRLDLLLGSLTRARLVSADLSGASLFGANVHKAVVGATRFDKANLKMTPLDGRADLLE